MNNHRERDEPFDCSVFRRREIRTEQRLRKRHDKIYGKQLTASERRYVGLNGIVENALKRLENYYNLHGEENEI